LKSLNTRRGRGREKAWGLVPGYTNGSFEKGKGEGRERIRKERMSIEENWWPDPGAQASISSTRGGSGEKERQKRRGVLVLD